MKKITNMMVARLRLGLTQAELAWIIKVTQPRISIWESGMADIPPARRTQLAAVLYLKPEELEESAL